MTAIKDAPSTPSEAAAPAPCGEPAAGHGEIHLVARADDLGSCHAANLACIRCYEHGIVRSVEVMTPCAWFPEAVELLREHPGLDAGVHLTLTSEWQRIKWRPLTHAPSIVDDNGYFYPTTSQRKNGPANTGFLESGWKLDEVRRELRAQVELARKHIRQLSHLSSHMLAPTCTPELRAIVSDLAREYSLPLNLRNARSVPGFDGVRDYAAKESKLAAALERLTPGLWLFVEHPGMDVPEMQAMGHLGYEDVAIDREGVTRAFCSEKVKEVIARKNIRLLSCAEAAELP